MVKKMMCAGLLLLSAGMVFAQKAKVNKASNALVAEPVNYEAARQAIGEAKLDSLTAHDPKTWYVAGRIGYTQANAELSKAYVNQTPNYELMAQGLDEMFKNYLKADSLDGKVLDKKGNPKYTQRKNIKNDLKEMQNWFINAGGSMFDQRKYGDAYTMFSEYAAICDLPIFDAKDKIKVDSTYNQMKYYAAIAALRNEDTEHARPLLDDLKNCPEQAQAAYELLVTMYQQAADTLKFMSTLNESVSKFPDNKFFMGTLINHYVNTGSYESAITYLDKVIAQDTANMEYKNVKAELLVSLHRFEEARAILEPEMAQNADNARALFLLGRSYAFEGDYIQEKAADLTDNKAYNDEMKKAKELYKKSLEYFVPAKEKMDATSDQFRDLLQNMKVVYLRLQENEKYKAIDEELKNLP